MGFRQTAFVYIFQPKREGRVGNRMLQGTVIGRSCLAGFRILVLPEARLYVVE
jgi:hypothetical protein